MAKFNKLLLEINKSAFQYVYWNDS